MLFSDSFYSNFLHTQAVQVSELLVSSKGAWESGEPVIVGLASYNPGWPILSYQKLQNLEIYCNDPNSYNEMLGNFGFIRSKVKINVSESEVSWSCNPPIGIPEGGTTAHVKRFALSENQNPMVVDVWVW